jgi:hypothetical protein
MMSTPTFCTTQQVFALSMWSNKATWQNGDADSLAKYLQTQINAAYQTYETQVGNWETVWGPAVFVGEYNRLSTTLADNAMYVAYNSVSNTYVVAIAATNAQSSYDWAMEDFQVGSTVPFTPVGAPIDPSLSGAVISVGTNLGIGNLLGLKPQAGFPGAGLSLQTFLADLPKQSYWQASPTLFFTGHSLGGALSPALALSLFPSAQSKAPFGYVYVIPTAGATPWNEAFTNGFNTVFPQTLDPSAAGAPYGYFNTALWNYYDVVPHAWYLLNSSNTDTAYPPYVCQPWGGLTDLSAKESLYGTLQNDVVHLDLGAYQVSWLVSHMAGVAAGSGVSYVPLQNNIALGQKGGPTPPPPPPLPPIPSPMDQTTQFVTMLARQHIGAYYSLLDVPAIYDPSDQSHWLEAVLNLLLQYIESHIPIPSIPK